ncbi:hypothetical protein [Streptomyces sp. SID13031]|uniref:hypothetical protein n=1 Tax=Streptomyces sp. SID13031 TaxID=2706046 RepID=UPI0013CB546B|nr:hypothetical protein [Streptomyces sp. SID13031]NEA33711.1 hypothetical protein [Streptomyces sp. SID13031]
MKLHRGLAAMLVVTLTTLTACGSGPKDSADTSSSGKVTLEQRYGKAPVKSPKDMTYQPGVVIIGGGPKAIRHVSSDGLTWTMDKSASGMSDLAPGKVMYASSKALGKVVKVEPAGDDVAVLLAPIELTDLIKDGTLEFDEPLDVGAAGVQQIPDAPGAYTDLPKDPDSDGTTEPTEPEPTNPEATEPEATEPQPTSSTPTDEATEPPAAEESDPPPATEEPTEPEETDLDGVFGPEEGGGSAPMGASLPQQGLLKQSLARQTAVRQSSQKQSGPEQIVIAPELKIPAQQAGARAGTGGQLPPPDMQQDNGKVKVSIGNWDFEYYSRSNSRQSELGLRATAGKGSKNAKPGLKGGFTLRMDIENLRAKAKVPIAGGRVQNSTVALNGLKQIAVDLKMGSGEGLADNSRGRIEIPLDIPLKATPVAELGFQPSIKFKLIIKLGFSSKNTTVSGTIAYTIGGDLGTSAATTVKPAGLNPVKLWTSASMAPFGIVAAFEVKIMIGLGLPGMNAGPYVKAIVSLGYANAGLMGAVPCSSLTESFTVSWGVGANVSSTVSGVLGKLFGTKGVASIKPEAEYQKGTYTPWPSKTHADPDTKHCRAE